MLYTISMKKAFRVFALCMSLTLVACTPDNSGKTSTSFYDVVTEQTVSWTECLSQPESHYVVYFYSETCSQCQEIKGDVILFARINTVKTYFLDINAPGNEVQRCSEEEVVVGVDDVADLYIVATPTIVEVQDGVTTANVVGKNRCLELINNLKTNNQN